MYTTFAESGYDDPSSETGLGSPMPSSICAVRRGVLEYATYGATIDDVGRSDKVSPTLRLLVHPSQRRDLRVGTTADEEDHGRRSCIFADTCMS